MKTLVTHITLMFFLANSTLGQDLGENEKKEDNSYRNYIGLQGGTFFVNNKENLFPWLGTFGLNYNRRFGRYWYIEAAYQMWLPGEWGLFGQDYYWIERKVDGTPYKIGEMVVSEYFKMFDVSGLYNLISVPNKHKILLGIGLTRYWGDNYYVEGVSIYHPSSYIRGAGIRESFWGITPQLNYRYTFLKDRLSVGLTIKHRYILSNKMSTERNYLMTVGFNF